MSVVYMSLITFGLRGAGVRILTQKPAQFKMC